MGEIMKDLLTTIPCSRYHQKQGSSSCYNLKLFCWYMGQMPVGMCWFNEQWWVGIII